MENAQIENIINELHSMWYVEDLNKTYHPEENVLVHCLQTMVNTKKVSSDPVLILASALHDIAKSNYKPYSVLHAHNGAKFLKENGVVNSELIFLVEQHMRFHKFISGEMTRPTKVMEIANSPMLRKQVILHRSDCSAKERMHVVYYDFDIREKLIDEVKELLRYVG